MTTTDSPRIPRWEFAVWAGVAVTLAWAFHRYQLDDAFITFRYGQNLALGRGLVFNPGVRMMGSTAPGQALLSALVHLLTGTTTMPKLMTAIGVFAWCAQAIAFRRLIDSELGAPVPARITALLTLLGIAAQPLFVSMETSTVIALELWALWWLRSDRLIFGALALAIAVTFRADAVLFAALGLGFTAMRHRRNAVKSIVIFILAASVWPAFSMLYFGSALPRTLAAKYGRTPVLDYVIHEVRNVPHMLIPTEPEFVNVAAVVAWVFIISGAVRLIRSKTWLVVLPLHAFAHLALYAVLRPFRQHTWHLVPALVSLTPCLVWGAAAFIRASWSQFAKRATVGLGVGVLSLSLSARLIDTWFDIDSGFWTAGRTRAYDDAIEFLKGSAKPEESLASLEVGYIAYWSDRRMVDLGGLISAPPMTMVNGVEQLDERQFDWALIDQVIRRPYFVGVTPQFESEHLKFKVAVYRSRATKP